MSVIDLEDLLLPISPDLPSGDDLEYDPEFGELERTAEGKAEQQIGETVIPAEEPDWRKVRTLALSLLKRTKDIRVLMSLSRALLRVDGLPGFADGIQLLCTLIEQQWATIHPQLDADDDNDPTFRINTLMTLCGRDSVLDPLRNTPIVQSRALGVFSFRDVQIVQGVINVSADQSAPDAATLDGAFMDCEVEQLQAQAQALERILAATASMEAFVTEQVGVEFAPNLEDFQQAIKEIAHELNQRLAQRGVVDASPALDVGDGVAAETTQQAVATAPGQVNSREDVIRSIDKICEYFERHEPSSPVPMLLQRAKRLVSKDFMEIMRDLAPDGVSQAEMIGGIKNDEY